jgi:hypothetical protein
MKKTNPQFLVTFQVEIGDNQSPDVVAEALRGRLMKLLQPMVGESVWYGDDPISGRTIGTVSGYVLNRTKL